MRPEKRPLICWGCLTTYVMSGNASAQCHVPCALRQIVEVITLPDDVQGLTPVKIENDEEYGEVKWFRFPKKVPIVLQEIGSEETSRMK